MPQAQAAFIAAATPGTATSLGQRKRNTDLTRNRRAAKTSASMCFGAKKGRKEAIFLLQGPSSSRIRGSGMVSGPWHLCQARQRRLSHLPTEGWVNRPGRAPSAFHSPRLGKKMVLTSPLGKKKKKRNNARQGAGVEHSHVPLGRGKTVAKPPPPPNTSPSPPRCPARRVFASNYSFIFIFF